MSGRKRADSGAPTPINAGVGNLRYRSDYKNAALPPHPEDVARWQRFLAELPERIAAIRGEAIEKPCSRCGTVRPLDQFHRDRSQAGGRVSVCKPCVSEQNARQYQDRKRAAFRRTA